MLKLWGAIYLQKKNKLIYLVNNVVIYFFMDIRIETV